MEPFGLAVKFATLLDELRVKEVRPRLGIAVGLRELLLEGARPPQRQTTPSEPLTYLFPFPEASCSRVRVEMLRADQDFAREEGARWLTNEDRRSLAVRWISRILGVFASEACNLARLGAAGWNASQTELRVNDVLRLLTASAERSKFIEGSRPDLTNNDGNVSGTAQAEIVRSAEWSAYQDNLLNLMDQCSELLPGRCDPILAGENSPVSVLDERPDTDVSRSAPTASLDPKMMSDSTEDLDRFKTVDAFLDQCNQESADGFKVQRTHIWRAAGHSSPQQFQRWQRRNDHATHEDERNFGRILSMSPGEFISLLKKKGIPYVKP